MRIDNLQVADGISVRAFLTTYYSQILESAENIIRGNTKFDQEQRKELAVDLVSMLALHLLNMQLEPPNVGKYSHKWMKNQVCWQRTDFEKLSKVNSHDYDFNIKDENSPELEDRLSRYIGMVSLNPFEQVVFDMIRNQLTVKEMIDELGGSVPAGTIHNTLRLIKQKFAIARAEDLINRGDTYIATEDVAKAIDKINARNNKHSVSSLPDDYMDSKSTDSAA